MKICFLSRFDPFNHNAWSGICYQMYAHLSVANEVVWIGNARLDTWLRVLIRVAKEWDRLRNKRRGYSHFNKFICRLKARNVERLLKKTKFDLIFTVNSPDYIAYLNTNLPIVYARDTTFELFINYYPSFYGLGAAQIKEGNEIEANALSKAWKVVYSSAWAANSAIHYYGTAPGKISVVDFGANLHTYPSRQDFASMHSDNDVCHILFVGVDWTRKGGALTYNTFLRLRKEGFRCKLTIVGSNPHGIEESDDVVVIPFLNKRNPQEFSMLYKIYTQAHFLLLPTRADCTPIVFSEAAAFGLPVITTDTGGISSVIQEGINGFLMPMDADAAAYAEKIKSVFQNKPLYKKLRASSRSEFDTRLSWEVWMHKINSIVASLPTAKAVVCQETNAIKNV